jgi:hypothetical protein
MPGFVHSQQAYYRLVERPNMQGLQPEQTLGQGSYSGLKGRVEDFLSKQTADQQFERDTAMWYGALIRSAESWKAGFLKRLFAVLYYGGLMIRRDDGWQPWAGQRIPICASISHGARVLIWLPENDQNEAFWRWLWGTQEPQSRGAATHGVAPVEGPVTDISSPNRVMKGVRETKGNIAGMKVKHFGVNLALGGSGNLNPITGKEISENGKHGHLYIAYFTQVRKLLGHNQAVARYAILVGTEQSSPFDRQVAVKGKAGHWKSVYRGGTKVLSVPDQYGGAHGLGGHSRFNVTGGDDFSYKDKPTKLGAYGPSHGNYYDGMYIDLCQQRWKLAKDNGFDETMLGGSGIPPRPVLPH